jgi:hypothetical protein
MGGGKGPKAPKAPDYAALAQQDAAAQLAAANQITGWNRPDQTDQYGNTIDWTQSPEGAWSQEVKFGGTQQQIQDAADAAKLAGIQGFVNQPGFQYEPLGGGFGYGGGGYSAGNGGPSYGGGGGYSGSSGGGGGSINYPSSGTNDALAKAADPGIYENMIAKLKAAGGDPGKFKNLAGAIGNFDSTQGDKVAADLYEATMGRFRPEAARNQEALDVKLRLQGLQPGTEAYNRAMQNMMTSIGDVSTQAGLNSTLAGYNAARDIYNTNLGGQGQRFDQQLGGWQANLGRNDQLNRNNLARKEFNYGMQDDTWENNLARQGQLEGQNIDREGISAQLSAARSAAAASRYGADKQFDLGRMQEDRLGQGQMFDQALTAYRLPYEKYSYMTGTPGGQTGFTDFSTATGYNPASMSNAAQNGYNANMAGYNAGQGKKGNTMNNMTSLGSAAISASA